jgi:hypothetical protein
VFLNFNRVKISLIIFVHFRFLIIYSNMTHTSNERIVLLNPNVGYLFMEYLDGLNVISFMVAVNGTEQFSTIAITNEQIFFQRFMKLMKKEKSKLMFHILIYTWIHVSSTNKDIYVQNDITEENLLYCASSFILHLRLKL